MRGAWVRFVSDGEPGWERWDARHPVRRFGNGAPHTAYGPRDRELALWTTDTVDAPQAPPPGTPSELRRGISRLRRNGALRRR
ncbi:hypothetical protein [Streptomyces hirsutus]|uniref:hypothetical protein n=1 Tax=Streptomyces hirsutus TaxID=35620 RepID=UPI003869A677